MPPAFIAAVFGCLGLAAIRASGKSISSGTASSGGWTCTLDDNPVGFCLIISMRAAIVGFAIAEILYGVRAGRRPHRAHQARAAFLP
jgi:hypothetical protein